MKARFLHHDKKASKLKIIDDNNFLDFKKNSTRLELHLFAATISGFVPTPFENQKAIVRSEQVDSHLTAMPYITAAYVGQNIKDKCLFELLDSDKCFKFIDECANTGYSIIETIIKDNSDIKGYIGQLLDEKFEVETGISLT